MDSFIIISMANGLPLCYHDFTKKSKRDIIQLSSLLYALENISQSKRGLKNHHFNWYKQGNETIYILCFSSSSNPSDIFLFALVSIESAISKEFYESFLLFLAKKINPSKYLHSNSIKSDLFEEFIPIMSEFITVQIDRVQSGHQHMKSVIYRPRDSAPIAMDYIESPSPVRSYRFSRKSAKLAKVDNQQAKNQKTETPINSNSKTNSCCIFPWKVTHSKVDIEPPLVSLPMTISIEDVSSGPSKSEELYFRPFDISFTLTPALSKRLKENITASLNDPQSLFYNMETHLRIIRLLNNFNFVLNIEPSFYPASEKTTRTMISKANDQTDYFVVFQTNIIILFENADENIQYMDTMDSSIVNLLSFLEFCYESKIYFLK